MALSDTDYLLPINLFIYNVTKVLLDIPQLSWTFVPPCLKCFAIRFIHLQLSIVRLLRVYNMVSHKAWILNLWTSRSLGRPVWGGCVTRCENPHAETFHPHSQPTHSFYFTNHFFQLRKAAILRQKLESHWKWEQYQTFYFYFFIHTFHQERLSVKSYISDD